MSVLEKMVLRKVFGPDKYELTGGWRLLNGEALYCLYCTLNVVTICSDEKVKSKCHPCTGTEILYRQYGP